MCRFVVKGMHRSQGKVTKRRTSEMNGERLSKSQQEVSSSSGLENILSGGNHCHQYRDIWGVKI